MVMTEYSKRSFLDGKKKNNQASRFKCEDEEGDDNFMRRLGKPTTKGLDGIDNTLAVLMQSELSATKGKDHALISSLVPEHVSITKALAKIEREKKKKEEEKERIKKIMEDAKNLYKDDALVESKEVEDDKGNDASGTRMLGRIGEVVGALADSYDTKSRHQRDEIKSWQQYSINEAVKMKNGSHMTLPVLCLQGTNPLAKPPKKSSLKYGGGNMARIEGQDEITFTPVSSYLTVFERSFHKEQKEESPYRRGPRVIKK